MSEPPYLSHLFAKARQNGVPLGGTFELTSRCNLECEMCYIHSKSGDSAALAKEKSASWWIDTAREACSEGTLMLLITGGEPLLHPGFSEIYRECVRLGMLVSVNTNGTMITDEVMRLFTEYPPSKLNVSLYGASAQTYEHLCKNGAMFERVTNAVEKLQKAGINLKLNFSITHQNSGDIEEVTAFAAKRGLQMQSATYMFPPVRSKACACAENHARPTALEAGENAARVLLAQTGEERFTASVQKMKECMSRDIACDGADSGNDKSRAMLCRAGASTFWITYDGEMLPCGMMTQPRIRLGGEMSFLKAWTYIKGAVSEIRLPLKCTECTHRALCEVCAASCFAETGSFDAVPLYQCEKTQSFIDFTQSLTANGRINE